MAKITRILHKIFGDDGSSDNFAKFGSLVAGDPIKTKDLLTIQSLPAWSEGWQSAIYGANKDLLLQDFNSFCYEHSRQMAYIFQAGVPEWNVSTTYFKGSIVQRTTGGGDATGELYMSAIDNNVGNAVPTQANNANWTWLNPPQVPPGTSLDFMGIDVPTGFYGEDGTAKNRTTDAVLFAAITKTLAGNLTVDSAVVTGIPSTTGLQPGFYMSGTGIQSGAKILTVDGPTQVTMTLPASSTQTPSTICFAPHGVGDGSTTFTLPDSRRRTMVGAGGAGTAVLANAVGAIGGEETHQLTTAELAAHRHVVDGWTGLGVTHNGAVTTDNSPTAGGSTQDTGGDQGHNNMQPSLVVTKIIKY